MIVLEAIKQEPEAIKHADDKFKSNAEFILEAVKRSGRALK